MEITENNTVTDIDGNTYNVIQIGKQFWTAENLNVSKYRNGDEIPQVQDAEEWAHLETGAWCYYENKYDNGITYSKLYNWYAINDPRGLTPEGYLIPSDKDWKTLTKYLGGDKLAGLKMKVDSLNNGLANENCFSGLPGGYRYHLGTFHKNLEIGAWWSSSEYDKNFDLAWYFRLAESGDWTIGDYEIKRSGFSARLIKDNTLIKKTKVESAILEKIILKDKEGISYNGVQIGKQFWMTENLSVSKYRNGDEIPQVQDKTEWANLKTGAWCYYDNLDKNGRLYGKLYNWHAINDPRGLTPEGFHIPSEKEWISLTDYIEPLTGVEKLKQSLFRATIGGYRSCLGEFYAFVAGFWWSSSEGFVTNNWAQKLKFSNDFVHRSYFDKQNGLYVRCIKD